MSTRESLSKKRWDFFQEDLTRPRGPQIPYKHFYIMYFLQIAQMYGSWETSQVLE